MSAPETDRLLEPRRYRVVVRSAAEAVALVREKFGDRARVVAVRQVEAGGLARFLQKPRLEVIVEVGGAESSPPAPAAPENRTEPAAPSAPAAPAAPAPAPAATTEPGTPEPPQPGEAEMRRKTVARPAEIHRGWLRATGLDPAVLERVRTDQAGLDWESLGPAEGLAHLAAWLKTQYEAVPRRPLGRRRVLLGSHGAGKTTALCKLLALEAFVRGQRPAVLKLDGEQPNATDGLAAFCDVAGAPLLRSAAELEEFEQDALVLVDLPGVGLEAAGEHQRLARMLDALRVDTRILVANAAYESELIGANFDLGRACGATHVIFTHLDEVRRPAKLWRHVLFGGLRPIALTSGPSPAGEIEEDVFSALLAHTFPPRTTAARGTEGGGR